MFWKKRTRPERGLLAPTSRRTRSVLVLAALATDSTSTRGAKSENESFFTAPSTRQVWPCRGGELVHVLQGGDDEVRSLQIIVEGLGDGQEAQLLW